MIVICMFEGNFPEFSDANCTEIRRYALVTWILCCGITFCQQITCILIDFFYRFQWVLSFEIVVCICDKPRAAADCGISASNTLVYFIA